MNEESPVLESMNGTTATLTLNRPAVKNAMNGAMVRQLTEAFDRLNDEPRVRAIVLAAKGDVFCSGADLAAMRQPAGDTGSNATTSNASAKPDSPILASTRLARLFRTIDGCPKPVVAQVQGACFAGAMGLVCASDILVASSQALFCLPEVKVGLVAATISPFVARAMGQRAARRYFLTGEVFGASQALNMGLVHEVCEPGQLEQATGAVLQAIGQCAPGAVAASKQLLQELSLVDASDDALHDQLVERLSKVRSGPEAAEGIAAFLEKRKPNWIEST